MKAQMAQGNGGETPTQKDETPTQKDETPSDTTTV